MKHAGVLKWKSQYLAHADSINRQGLLSPSAPYVSVACSASDKEIGQTVLLSLSGSSFRAPKPGTPEDDGGELLALAQVRSWDDLKSAANVNIEQPNDGSYRLIPMRPAGRKFEPIAKMEIRLPRTATCQELGAALKKCMAMAELHSGPSRL